MSTSVTAPVPLLAPPAPGFLPHPLRGTDSHPHSPEVSAPLKKKKVCRSVAAVAVGAVGTWLLLRAVSLS